MTVNLGNLPASAGRETLIVPAEAVFNPDNRPKNEPVVWVVKGDNAHRYLEERKVTVGEVTSQEWRSPTVSARVNRWLRRA
nr:Uncharacterised protein [Klebsiella pneumoniae]